MRRYILKHIIDSNIEAISFSILKLATLYQPLIKVSKFVVVDNLFCPF